MQPEGGFGVYVHWPYCLAKCPYCDFNSHVSRTVDHDRWRAAYKAEIAALAARYPERQAETVFFGGGTPSLMEPETVETVLEAIDAAWGIAQGAEITLEANPTSVEAGRFEAFRAAGVNRVSLGVQALNDADLKRLGRMHSAAEARAAFDVARDRFERVSFDLIYARQGQSVAAWEAELEAALAMAVDHLSLYQLTIEPGTRFGELADLGKLRDLPTDDIAAEMYEITQGVTEGAGLPAYEVSNHARPGAASRHNQIYWRYGDYAGIGPGAHGRMGSGTERLAMDALREPLKWLGAVEAGHATTTQERLSSDDQATEYLLMALRLREGASLDRFAALKGEALGEERIRPLVEDGLMWRDGPRIGTTRSGGPILNALLRHLLA